MTDGTNLQGCFSSAKPHHDTSLWRADTGVSPYKSAAGYAKAVFRGENQLEYPQFF